MPEYLLSVWHDDDYTDEDLTTPENQRLMAQTGAFNDELVAAGAFVYANGFESNLSATVVRTAGREVSMTDGPYAESKEQMGGFWIIEVADLDAALEWAAKGSAACEAPVEVRTAHQI